MDMGQQPDPGAVDVAAPDDGGATITITITGDQIAVNGEPVADIGEALKVVLDAYDRAETPDGAQAQFDSGFGAPKAAKPVGRMGA